MKSRQMLVVLMRDYSIVTPAFWIGQTGKQLRGDLEAQLLAVYLMTSPHSSMTGVFHCPVLYMAHETGITLEGASKALQRLCEAGFCEYEEATESVFVFRMARFQIASNLKPGDNRIAGLRKDVEKMSSPYLRSKFLALHSEAFCLDSKEKKTSPSEAPPKPRTRTGTGTGEKTVSSAGKLPTCPIDEIVAAYNEILPEMVAVKVIDDERKAAIKKRWEWVLTTNKPDGTKRAVTADDAVNWFKAYFNVARDNDFLMGRTEKSADHKNWKCDIEHLLSSKGIKQVIEKTEVKS